MDGQPSDRGRLTELSYKPWQPDYDDDD